MAGSCHKLLLDLQGRVFHVRYLFYIPAPELRHSILATNDDRAMGAVPWVFLQPSSGGIGRLGWPGQQIFEGCPPDRLHGDADRQTVLPPSDALHIQVHADG